MKRFTKYAWAALVGAFAFAPLAHAHTGLGLGPHYTRSETQDSDSSADLLGATARLRTPLVGLEAAIDYRRDEDILPGMSFTSWPVTASVLFSPIPFAHASAGIGWYRTTVEFDGTAAPENETFTDFGYHAGAGVEVPVSRQLSLTGDLRWVTVDREFDELDTAEELRDVDSDFVTMQVGALLYFSSAQD